MKPRASSWSANETIDDDAEPMRQRAAETMGYSMTDCDAFEARRQYAQNWPGEHGPENHLKFLIRRSERQMDEAIALGRTGGKK